MSRKLKKTHLFSKDVASLLYAYGDAPQPLPETVQCVDELVSGYLVDICTAAYRTAQTVHRNKIKVEDFKFVLRNDPVKLGRAEELMQMSKVITEARKQFDNSEGKSLKRARGEEVHAKEDEEYDEENDLDETDELQGSSQLTGVEGSSSKKKGNGPAKKKKKKDSKN